ncbi:MAG: class I SAM-dependent methyltransferase [Candidatus Gracilibacteria bacterium]
MSVDYNNFATTFSQSRKNMKWEEIDYFIDFLKNQNPSPARGRLGGGGVSILDVGCGNGRLLAHIENSGIKIDNYLGTDLSVGLIDEAKKLHPHHNFQVLDMLDLQKLRIESTPSIKGARGFSTIKNFDYIFFIASFHHLHTIEERLEVLKQAKNLIKPDGIIFMTNWALNSELNSEKYKNSVIKNSKNEFGSEDYNIKIGEFTRFYHCFSSDELEFLFKETGFEVVENRLFENGRNWVSIIENR